PIEAERFHAKTREHAAIDHRFAEIGERDFANGARQIAGHAAGKCVPCPGWIVNVFERIRTAAEKFIFAKEQRAVLAFLDRKISWTRFANSATSFDQTGFLHHLARFAVVQNQKIDMRQKRIEI